MQQKMDSKKRATLAVFLGEPVKTRTVHIHRVCWQAWSHS